jgi:threonine/homoserine/homoserine lactone efflux protein
VPAPGREPVATAYDLLLGIALGFSLTIPPGPMNALIASQTVRSLREGVITGLGAMTADLGLGILVYALRSEVDVGVVARWIYLVGAVVMGFLGARLLLRRSVAVTEPEGGIRTYSQGVFVGLTNPFQILWWLTAGLAFAYFGGLVLFLGLFAAIGVWVLAFPYALHLGTRRRPRAAEAVRYGSAAILFAFAVYFVVLAV